jgi:hypothetical protein
LQIFFGRRIESEFCGGRGKQPILRLVRELRADWIHADVFGLGSPIVEVANRPVVKALLPDLHFVAALLADVEGTASFD